MRAKRSGSSVIELTIGFRLQSGSAARNAAGSELSRQSGSSVTYCTTLTSQASVSGSCPGSPPFTSR